MDPVTPILIGIATKVGAPIVKGLLEKYLGGTAGNIGGVIIDSIAEKVGVKPEQLDKVDPQIVADAIVQTESETPELIAAWNEQQKAANELMLAEMNKGDGTWTWAWRPAWMWFLMVIWGFQIIFVPVVNASLGVSIHLADLGVVTTLTMAYLGLYMGGNTAKSIWGGKTGDSK